MKAILKETYETNSAGMSVCAVHTYQPCDVIPSWVESRDKTTHILFVSIGWYNNGALNLLCLMSHTDSACMSYTVEPLYKKQGHLSNEDAIVNHSYNNVTVYKILLKCGHLNNQDTFCCPKGVHNHCTHCLFSTLCYHMTVCCIIIAHSNFHITCMCIIVLF